ncbi:MAG: acetolactate decarboxylase [Candidatus Hydrogenedentes bacterium]|nr:acetolactate decarboxylase [Candidatus Hydrogenedentota bacterium]
MPALLVRRSQCLQCSSRRGGGLRPGRHCARLKAARSGGEHAGRSAIVSRRDFFILLLAGLAPLFAPGCAHSARDNTLFQVSTIDALLEGAYDGEYRVGALTRNGDLGIGTFNALEGEMIVLDGEVYQARADGQVLRMPREILTPFATVVPFEQDHTLSLEDCPDFAAFERRVDAALPSPNYFYAFRASGTFAHVRVRSVPRQEKPYPRLPDVVATQSVFDREEVRGTLLGFRCPAYSAGLNVPGYHLHFLSDDKTFGGHVLDFRVTNLRVAVDQISDFRVWLPENVAFGATDLSVHKADDLHRVEKQTGTSR